MVDIEMIDEEEAMRMIRSIFTRDHPEIHRAL